MMYRGVYAMVIAGGMVFAPTLASAAFVSADFRSEFDLPDGGSSGARVFQNLADPVAGVPDLSSIHEIANPSGWGGSATTDLDAAGLITLTGDHEGDGFADYDLAIFQISGIVFDAGESIVGVSALTAGLLEPTFGVGVFAPLISFTADSVTITYDTSGRGNSSDFEFMERGSSTFQIKTSAGPTPTVPVPAALPLMAGAFGLLGWKAYRRKAA